VAVQLQDDGAAPRQSGDVRRSELEDLDQRRKAVGVVRQAEVRRDVRGAACSWFVPGDDRELVSEGGELRPPDSTVLGGAI